MKNKFKDNFPIIEEPKDYDVSTYFGFHLKLKGKQFDNDGRIRSKLSVFCEFRKDDETLKKLASGKYPHFKVIDKQGWKDGIFYIKNQTA